MKMSKIELIDLDIPIDPIERVPVLTEDGNAIRFRLEGQEYGLFEMTIEGSYEMARRSVNEVDGEDSIGLLFEQISLVTDMPKDVLRRVCEDAPMATRLMTGFQKAMGLAKKKLENMQSQ